MPETTVHAFEISGIAEGRRDDVEVNVQVLRSCTFLMISRNGEILAHVDISAANWGELRSTPQPVDAPRKEWGERFRSHKEY